MNGEQVWEQRVEEMVLKYSSTVYKLALAQLRCRSDADDVYQNVFLRYVRRQPEFENAEHEKAWFLRVTLNCCKKLWASPWRKRSVPLTDDLAYDAPENHYLTEELKKLPPKYSAVLHLFYWEDMSAEEIGKLLGLRPASVRSQLSRARVLLKDQMRGENSNAGTGI